MEQPTTSASRASSFVSFVWYRIESSIEAASAPDAQYSRRYAAYATGTIIAMFDIWHKRISKVY